MTTKHLTAEVAVAAAQKEAIESDSYVEFEGQNCNDYDDDVNCSGWDGSSRRCSCGNRRVYWDTYHDEKTGYVAYGQAY